MRIPKEDRVKVVMRYNGFLHESFGMKWEENGEEGVRIFVDQFPKGFREEHDSNELYLTGLPIPIVPDLSGDFGWVLPDVFDLDEFAGR